MKTAFLSFALALVAPTAALAADCPLWADGADFDVVIHLELATNPTPAAAPLLWQLGPGAPMPSGFGFSAAPPEVRAQADTATAWAFLYGDLEQRRLAHNAITCEQIHTALQIAKRSELHERDIYRVEAEAFWAAYFTGFRSRAVALQNPVRAGVYLWTISGSYPAQDLADMLGVLGL